MSIDERRNSAAFTHNDLSGLQGGKPPSLHGDPTEAYHLTAAQYAGLGSSGSGGGSGFQTLTDAATIAWDCSLGSGQVTLGASRAFGAPSNMVAGQQYFLKIIQDGTGGRTITAWNSAFYWPSNIPPTLSPTKNFADVLTFVCTGTYMMFTGITKNITNTGVYLTYSTNLSTWIEARLQTYRNNGINLCVDNDTVYLSRDQSAALMDGVQVNAGNRPIWKDNIINGMPVLRFDGTTARYLKFATMAPGNSVSFFIVIKPNTTTPIGIFDGAPNTGPEWLRNYNNAQWDDTGADTIDFTLPNTNPVLLEFVHTQTESGRTVKYYKNGALITTATNPDLATLNWADPTIGTINLGNDGKLDGDIAAFLCFHESISDSNRALVELYLRGIYATW